MDNSNIQQTPCLVQTPQGVSVSYKNKLLYSRYAPQRAINQIIENLTPLPGTIFLCLSPVMPYGLKELSQKLPENCLLLGCENNPELYHFTKEQLKNYEDINNFTLLSPEELYDLPPVLAGPETQFKNGFIFPGAGKYRRIVSIDFSAGTQFNPQFYSQLSAACVNALMTFWANRVTLTKFGRLYSRNFFKNLKKLPETTPISNYTGKITKPIIVCGAGESLDSGIKDFEQNRNDFYILCADTALQPLLKQHIRPDGVFIEEAQNVVSKAFIGAIKQNVHIFAGLSSLPVITHNANPANISFFTTRYANAGFINTLENQQLLPEINKPFGSVGLTAVHYALQFRKSTDIPVYIYGLDFSYSAGRTHTRGALAQVLRLNSTNKLQPVYNFGAAWNKNSFGVTGKDGSLFYTSQVMKNYADLFNGLFSSTQNLFDSGECGIKLNIPHKKPEAIKYEPPIISNSSYTKEYISKLNEYFINEKNELTGLRDILTGKLKVPAEELEEQITRLAKPREYLYLHFPDGTEFKYNQSFLNRIRTELEGFLKILEQ